jgi:predicted RNase H-like nuclease (RuvC/YqgF family)
MSDEELVKRLREDDTDFWHCEAADRIEALIVEKKYLLERVMEQDDLIEALTEQLEAARADAKEAEAYAEELEAKLAKAVEALRGVMQHMPDYADTVWQDARATLAEIEGEKG